jgi:hypothetical protein
LLEEVELKPASTVEHRARNVVANETTEVALLVMKDMANVCKKINTT